jgi:hypothetical protein
VSSKDKRFEVDGANVAREFLKREGETDERKLQLAWDAIAAFYGQYCTAQGAGGDALLRGHHCRFPWPGREEF